MPQINRIRVNNVKYNFGTQVYDDFMMRFNCRNTIYDLANGGGKSLLMLLLMQNMIPNTTLDDKQPLEKLFRQDGHNTVIHSLIEWKLDPCFQKDGYKYLLTGFCARKMKNRDEESEQEYVQENKNTDSVSVEYFNYCIFYRKYGENDIKNLPLVSNGEKITYNGLKTYLRELEKRDFDVSVKIFERKGSYQNFICKYGIYESEWEIIRGINRTEGHVRTYFETNYRTSRKVVEDLLIEEIIQKSFHNRLNVNDEEGLMAQTLMDIKDKLIQLSKKQAAINNYDRQTDALNEFAEYVSGYATLYEQKEKLRNELFDMLISVKKQLLIYKNQQEEKAEEIKNLEEQNILEHKKLAVAGIMGEKYSLSEINDNILEKENIRKKTVDECTKVESELSLITAIEEYQDWLKYNQLAKQLETVISGKMSNDDKSSLRMKEIASQMKVLNDQHKNAINDEISKSSLELKKINEKCVELDGYIKKNNNELKQLEADILYYSKCVNENEELAVSLMENAGLILMEKAQEEYDLDLDRLEDAQNQLEDIYNKTFELKENLKKLEIEKNNKKYNGEILKKELEKETVLQTQRVENEKILENLKKIYGSVSIGNIKDNIIDKYKNIETKISELKSLYDLNMSYIESFKKGYVRNLSKEREQLKNYLISRYGEDCEEGSQFIDELSEEKKKLLVERVPYIMYTFVIKGDFNRVKEDAVLTRFGRSQNIFPIVSEKAADEKELWMDSKFISSAYNGMSAQFMAGKSESGINTEIQSVKEENEEIKTQIENIKKNQKIILQDYFTASEAENMLDLTHENSIAALNIKIDNNNSEYNNVLDLIAKTVSDIEKSEEFEKKKADEIKSLKEKMSLLNKISDVSKKINVLKTDKKETENKINNILKAIHKSEDEFNFAEEKKNKVSMQLSKYQDDIDKIDAEWEKMFLRYYDENQYKDNEKLIDKISPKADDLAASKKLEKEDTHNINKIEAISQIRQELYTEFVGLGMVQDSSESEMSDKELLLEQYNNIIQRCDREIIRCGFNIEKVCETVKKDTAQYHISQKNKLLSSKKELEIRKKELESEINAQSAMKNRIEGSIEHGIAQIQQEYGTYEEFECDNYQRYISEHKNLVYKLQEDLRKLKQDQKAEEVKMQDNILIERDLTRIVEKAGMQIPENIVITASDNDNKYLDYENVHKEYDKILRLELRKAEEFMKKKEKLCEQLNLMDAQELSIQCKDSVMMPVSTQTTKSLVSRLNETIIFIKLEKDRIAGSIEDMEKIKSSFENRCIQTCCNIRTELDRLPKLSTITMDNRNISVIGLDIPYINEDLYEEKMSQYIDETVQSAEKLLDNTERLNFIKSRLSWKRLFSVIVKDMNQVRVSLYKRERLKDQSRYLRYEEAVGSTGQSQGIYIQFLIAVINYISSINAADDQAVLGKTIFIDNPFGAAKDIYIWEPIFKLLEANHVQLIVPARGATPAITGRFDINYILGQKLSGNRQQTVVVDYYSRTQTEELEYTRMNYEQTKLLFDN